MTVLTPEEAAAKVAALRAGDVTVGAGTNGSGVPSVEAKDTGPYRYAKPLYLAAESLISIYQNVEGRFKFGLREIDVMTRGIGNGELCYLTGRSHAGKTQVFLMGILNSMATRPVILFTPDETREIVLSKLYSMVTGHNAEDVERWVKEGDDGVLADIRRVAREEFANLLVIDDVSTISEMTVAVEEARQFYGRDLGAVGVDFLDMLSVGDDLEGTATKSKELKLWTKQVNLPVICVHQGSRTNSGKGQALGMEAMRYAGENEAIFVIGVRRLIDDPDVSAYDRLNHGDTIDVAVIKNKRPPMRHGEKRYHMDPNTGLITELHHQPTVPPAEQAPLFPDGGAW